MMRNIRKIEKLYAKKYFLLFIGIFIVSIIGAVLFIAFDTSGWASLFMMPFILLHALYLILFLIFFKIKYKIAFLFPAIVVTDVLFYILAIFIPGTANPILDIIPSYLIFSLIYNLLS